MVPSSTLPIPPSRTSRDTDDPSSAMAPALAAGPIRRIGLVCDWYLPRIGGIERHLAALAGHLVASGHEVTVITPWPAAAHPGAGVRIQRIPAALFPGCRLLWTPGGARRLGDAIRSGGFDVVHVHSSIVSPAAFVALRHAALARIPAVSTTHSILGGSTRAFAALDRLFGWSRWPVLYSAVSERVAREIRPLVAPQPVAVLPNAVDPDGWHAPVRPAGSTVHIACVMRLVPRKRGAALLRALQRACQALPDPSRVLLHVAGDGPERHRLESLSLKLGLGDRVRFRGALAPAEIRTLLADCDFFVLPCLLEAFGIAALEARAAGLPVVAMRESGVAEFITHEVDGLLAADDGQLAAHLVRLCSDQVLRSRIANHNRITPVTCTWDRVLTSHLAMYERARQLCAAR